MRIKPLLGLAVGPVDNTHWGQVLMTPHAYGIVEINDPSGDAQQKGAVILTRIGKEVSQPLTSLTQVEKIANAVWHDTIRTLILLVPVGRVVYVVLRGQGRVYVKRGGDLASLMHADGAVSGEVRKDDVILLVSDRFSSLLSSKEILGVFDHLPAPDVAEKLTLLLHEKPEGVGSVALVFEVDFVEDAPVSREDAVPALTRPMHPQSLGLRGVWERWKGISILNRIRNLRNNPRVLLRVGIALVITLFIVSVVAGIRKQMSMKTDRRLSETFSSARHAFDEGTALIELNPIKGRERLEEAKALLNEIMPAVNRRTKLGRDIVLLNDQVNDNLTQAMQITKAPLTLFYDMELLKKGAKADSLALEGSSLIVADAAGSAAFLVDTKAKKAQMLGGGEALVGVTSLAVHGQNAYALTADGIMKISIPDKQVSLVAKKDETWGNVSSLTSFGGNLYLLDTTKSRIWKYVAGSAGFSDMKEYLNPDALPNLSTANNMTIDGVIWVGTKIGTIMKFVQGQEESFLPKGVEPEFGTDLTVYATDETENIYVLDRSTSRVVVLDKEGIYLAQYQFEAPSRINAFVVGEMEKKILLLSDGKIYSINLK